MKTGNIFDSIPQNITDEIFELIIDQNNVKIERIISKGHTSPKSGWHEQAENEWVILLRGEAKIEFVDNKEICLKVGSHLNIPANTKHKVSWTIPDSETIWLTVHY